MDGRGRGGLEIGIEIGNSELTVFWGGQSPSEIYGWRVFALVWAGKFSCSRLITYGSTQTNI